MPGGGGNGGAPRLLRRASGGRCGRAPPRPAGTCGQAGRSRAARGGHGAPREQSAKREGAGSGKAGGTRAAAARADERAGKEPRPPAGARGPPAAERALGRDPREAPAVPAPPPLAHARPDLPPTRRPPSRSAAELRERGAGRRDAALNGRVPPMNREAAPPRAADPPPTPAAEGTNRISLSPPLFSFRATPKIAQW